MQEKLWTPEEIAERFRVPPATVSRLLREKKLKGIKFGGKWRVTESDLEAYLEQQQNTQDDENED